jgi:hypothetical protein
MRLLFCIFTLLFSLRPLCAKRPKIWQKKDVNEIVIKKTLKKKIQARKFSSARARLPAVVRRCKGKWTLWYQKKNNELVARHSLHADRVLARARTL